MAKVVVSDPLAPEGFQMLRDAGHEPVDIVGINGEDRAAALAEAEGWIIRSGTTLGPDDFAAAPKLRAVGRAGVGVDNVDLAAATAAGVAVFNAPTGNITSAAEQAWALMLAAARHVPAADAGMKAQQWLRKELKGTELAGKTIFIVGLGRIGRMMAARAQAFEMKCVGFDPFVTKDVAAGFGVERVEIDEGMARADFVTLHTPLTPQTRGMLDERRLAMAKEGQIIVNAARGGLIDEDALIAALDDGPVRAAGIDVWETEPPADWRLAAHPKVVAAPHLGASTTEAQLKAATQSIERVIAFLASSDAGLAVNAQASVPESMRPWARLAEALAGFAVQITEGTVEGITVCAEPSLDMEALKVHALVGAVRAVSDEPVNAINAPSNAASRGWSIATKELPAQDTGYVRIQVRSDVHEVSIEGTFTPHYGIRVTRIDGYDVEFRPEGRFLFTRHADVPGVLAAITGILAESKVNVANVSLARGDDGSAVAAIMVDGGIPKAARDGLRALGDVRQAHRVRLL